MFEPDPELATEAESILRRLRSQGLEAEDTSVGTTAEVVLDSIECEDVRSAGCERIAHSSLVTLGLLDILTELGLSDRDARIAMALVIARRVHPWKSGWTNASVPRKLAHDLTVCTFHSLGMAIIGKAEGKRPPLAATAENNQTLFDLLRGIVVNQLSDCDLAATMDEWLQEGFAPYRSQHEFKNWSEYYDYIRKFDIRSTKGRGCP